MSHTLPLLELSISRQPHKYTRGRHVGFCEILRLLCWGLWSFIEFIWDFITFYVVVYGIYIGFYDGFY